MSSLTAVMVGIVALAHAFFLVLEMVLWTRPVGRQLMQMTPEAAEATAVLAANQGLYNGVLCAGLVWSLLTPDPLLARSLQIFFLSAVVVVGVYGGLSAKPVILAIQALPGAVALALVLAGS